MPQTMRWITFALCVAALGCRADGRGTDARTRLIAVLRDSLGAETGPNVGFKVDNGQGESHLYVTFDTTFAPHVTQTEFEGRAREIALFALRHYEKASRLDSITVATRQTLQPGAWHHVHSRTFAVSSLRAPVTTPLPVATSGRSPAMADACGAFGKIFTASAAANGIPSAEVGAPRDTMMTFGERHDERVEPACRVAWKDEAARTAPFGDVLTRAKADGWTQRDQLMSADGPDGSVLAFSRGDVACLVSGSWDGDDDSDSTYVPKPGFEITASCFANRADRY